MISRSNFGALARAAGPWVCGAVWVASPPAASLAEAQTSTELVNRPSVASNIIAVAPFSNLSQRAEDDWIGAGIAETVSTDLGNLGWSVMPQTVFVEVLGVAAGPDRADEPALAILELCRELGVTSLIGGAFQRVGNQLRITIRIVDVRTDVVKYRTKIDGTLSDLFAAQDQVVTALVERLTPARDRERHSAVRRAPPTPMLETPVAPATAAPLSPVDVTGAMTLDTPELPARDRFTSTPGTGPPGVSGGGFAIGSRQRATVRRTSRRPEIDGRLDDPAWLEVRPITEFVQTSPVEGAPSTEATEVWLTYDSDNLYIAFYAHYTDPGIIRANRSERDDVRGDDQISVLFDPFLDQQRAYVFSVNGYGVPSDSILVAGESGGSSQSGSSSGSQGRSSGPSVGGSPSGSRGRGGGSSSSGFGIRGDRSWDALFETRGGLVNDGWTAEMLIPFKSLRYPGRALGEPHLWGFQISRNIREKSESLVWSPVSRNIAGQLTQMGILEGLIDLSTSKNLEILPTFTGVQTGVLDTTTGGFLEGDPLGEVGVSVKYGATSNLTLDFTYNPDFSQIESDRPQVEVNQRFALFYAEQRPFFLEGQEIFRSATPLNLVHTRTIVDPRFGAKLTGKVGRTTVGFFVADDEAPGRLDDTKALNFGRTAQLLIGRVRADLYAESYVGAIATTRKFGEDYSHVGGVDGRFRIGRTHRISFLAATSEHQDELNGRLSGPAIEFDFARQARNLSYNISHSSIDPNFRTETGFVPRMDIQQTTANVAYRWWPEGTLISWGPSFTYLRNHNHAAVLEDEQFRGEANLEFVRNLRFSGGISRDLERFGGIDFRKTGYSFFGLLSSRRVSVIIGTNGGDGIFFGDSPFLGRSTSGNFSFHLRPTSRLRTELRGVFSRFVDPANDAQIFDVQIYRWRSTYQFTDRLLLRHIMEHNTLSSTLGNNMLLTYRINAGTVAFLGYDDRYQQGFQIDEGFFPTSSLKRTNRAFFTKISYLFRY